MKINVIILILLLTVSCQNKNEPNKKYYQQSRYTKSWINKHNSNDVLEKIEIYVSKDFDTIQNQKIIYKNDKVQFQSLFYTLKVEPSLKDDLYNCKIKINSWLDSIPKIQIVETNFSFSFTQEINDSIYLKSVGIKNSTEINFSYKNFNHNLIEGILTGQIITKSPDSSKLEVSDIKLLVSNKSDINKALVETYFGKN
jgi:hypothetical protein